MRHISPYALKTWELSKLLFTYVGNKDLVAEKKLGACIIDESFIAVVFALSAPLGSDLLREFDSYQADRQFP